MKTKNYTREDIDKFLSERKPQKLINKTLKKKLKKIVKKEVIKHARKEAMSLLKLANREELGYFLFYFNSKSVVTLCVLDSIKDRLVTENVLVFNEGDCFGLVSNPSFNF